jgi:uncharacterized membrane protein YeaQ/YmgE (transglycosylase-associated protein family)
MSLFAAVVIVGVGLLAGWLSGLVMKIGGYGLKADVALGIVGSLGGAAVFNALSRGPETGWVPMVLGAMLGAASLLVVQRMFWQMPLLPPKSKR